jgi:flavin-dependent dehydrogenase
MLDVLIVGAGPAGAVAGLVLARAGARVVLVDRATFPRHKLCGDTVNPGTLAHLRRLGLARRVEACGLAIAGIRVTGEHGVAVEGRYPGTLTGRALVRRDFDSILLEHAIANGCGFEPGVTVQGAIVDAQRHGSVVTGVRLGPRESNAELRARVTIAADGRHSTIGFGMGLASHPHRPRRWAIGAYFEAPSGPTALPSDHTASPTSVGAQFEWGRSGVGAGVGGGGRRDRGESEFTPACGVIGEMHIRRSRYIGVEPLPGGITNVCLVKPSGPGDPALRDPVGLLRCQIAAEPMLRDRFAAARLVAPPVVLGPLAVDVSPEQIDGLLLAGDAAGFLDPMTGDGLRFAIEGGELAALAALDALQNGWRGVHARLAERRQRAFAAKHRFNRALRALVGSPRAVGATTIVARMMPFALRAIITRAGDCGLAASESSSAGLQHPEHGEAFSCGGVLRRGRRL